MLKQVIQSIGAGGVIACALAASAETPDDEALVQGFGDRATVSIATGSELALRRAPAVASVITAEDIRNMGAHDLDEVLESVAGIHVTRSGNSYFSGYTIRGIVGFPTNPQVLMLENGVPANSIFRGDRGQSIGAPLLENVARIEIIRGPGSALYGADAYSGVVNIITKTVANAPGTEVGARIGSYDSRNAWVQHAARSGNRSWAAYLQVGRSDGPSETVIADGATRLDRIFGTHASLAPGPLNAGADVVDAQAEIANDEWRLRAGYKRRWNAGLGTGSAFALDPVGKEDSERIHADLSWIVPQLARNWGVGFIGSYLQHIEDNNYVLYPSGTRFPNSRVTDPAVAALLAVPVGTSVSGYFPNGMLGSPGRWERQLRASAYATFSGFAEHSLRFGLGHEDLNLYKVRTIKNFWLSDNGTPVPTGAVIDYSGIQPHLIPHRRFNDYLYAQDEWAIAHDWTLTAGVRRDDYSDFGATTNPRLALVWDTAYNVTTKVLYGAAFRAPSMNEQYGVNPSGDGNPGLKPETIRTLEGVVSWQARHDAQINVNLYQYDTKDTIRALPKPGGVGLSFQNTGRQHGTGLEVEMTWDAGPTLRLSGNYAWQRSIDQLTDSDAGYAPHHHAYAKADWIFARDWTLTPQIDWVADRRRAFGDSRPPVPDYTTADLNLRYARGNGDWEFAATVRNLFDTRALEPTNNDGRLPYDLPLPTRSIWLQATYRYR